MDDIIKKLMNKSPSEIVLEQIKMTSFIQMCSILEKDNPNDTEFGTKIRKCIKTFNQNVIKDYIEFYNPLFNNT